MLLSGIPESIDSKHIWIPACAHLRQAKYRILYVGAGLASARSKIFQLSTMRSIIAKQWQNIPDFYDDV